MPAISNAEILQAVLNLQSQWPELLGAGGTTTAQSLLEVAGRDEESARQAANLLLDLFERCGALAPLRAQLRWESSAKEVRFYTPPGQPGPVATPGILYHCPAPGCSVGWELQVAGQTIPYCSVHPDQLLVPK